MTSLEIAELTGKRHDNVMRDIRQMLAELHGKDRVLSFEETVERPNPSGGASIKSPAFRLPRREVEILVTGYSITLRAKVINRLRELESEAAKPRRLTHLYESKASAQRRVVNREAGRIQRGEQTRTGGRSVVTLFR